ncbi:hypothetical protein [Streptomyces sp. NPDC085540]|uniref:hypothetical protein n=1 Tax=Streptomyces sp. NPDC085540 TaxID=3365730 RepID=UPI0037CDFB9F
MDVDLSEPIADYEAHVSVIRDAAVPLHAELTGLLTDLVRVLDSLAVDEPLVALKALADVRGDVAGHRTGRGVTPPGRPSGNATTPPCRK